MKSHSANRNRRFIAPLLAAAVVTATAGVAISAAADKPAPKEPPPNAVQVEMRMLEAALRDSVTAIAAGDVRKLPKRLHAVHIAAGDTEAALKSGKYKPPKGADNTEAFLALDADFHREMIQMVKAAKKNDVAKTATHFGGLMNRCYGCHQQFRDVPPKP